ncbi:MAG: hypothetical protein VKK97_10140 [Synechococcaceae cyanobacterium]|nr:hypothetical protein [Synechococcaceae cyanobacterium]
MPATGASNGPHAIQPMTTTPKQVWRDSYDQGQHVGEGITRCSDPDAGFYWVDVIMRGAPPLASCVRAHSGQQAVEFCKARHPNAVMVRLMEAS